MGTGQIIKLPNNGIHQISGEESGMRKQGFVAWLRLGKELGIMAGIYWEG